MPTDNIYSISHANSLRFKLKESLILTKSRLSVSVVFSGIFGYLLGWEGTHDWTRIFSFSIATFMITGAANIINQIIEKESDKLMKRTQNRPLPAGNLSTKEAIFLGCVLAFTGMLLLVVYINLLSGLLCFFSMVVYGFIYTPLKKITPLCVLVGAFPGALPPMIGWVAATGGFSVIAFIIFGFQFIWQFPHFWAIAWLADEDYRKAGFKMLPSKDGKGIQSAAQIMTYTLLLIPFGMLPAYYNLTGLTSTVIVTSVGLLFSVASLMLLIKSSDQYAKKLLFTSLIYLPLVQITLLLDKI